MTMTFREALEILSRRHEVQEAATDPRTGANLVLEAAHLVVTEVAALCVTDTDGLDNWIEEGTYTGNETPASIAAEWDAGQQHD
jgi:hypothetical protein